MKATHTKESVLSEQDIQAWLGANPDFFIENPDALTGLTLPQNEQGAVPLHHHQLRILRSSNEELLYKLNTIVANAKTHHHFLTDCLSLSTALAQQAPSGKKAHKKVLEAVKKQFGLLDASSLLSDDKNRAQLEELGALHGDSICISLPQAAVVECLGLDKKTQSCLLIPIESKGAQVELIALAAADATRFSQNMGMENLNYLCALIQPYWQTAE